MADLSRTNPAQVLIYDEDAIKWIGVLVKVAIGSGETRQLIRLDGTIRIRSVSETQKYERGRVTLLAVAHPA